MTQTAIDVFITLNVFSGRFDQRQLLAKSSNLNNDANTVAKENGNSINNRCDNFKMEEQDPFVFDHTINKDGKMKEEIWIDFMADCGDGFDPSYSISRLLAQPELILPFSNNDEDGDDKHESKTLPRGDILIIGGDLAYPNPTPDNCTFLYYCIRYIYATLFCCFTNHKDILNYIKTCTL